MSSQGGEVRTADPRHQLLELENRQRIYEYVRKHPGTYLRQLARNLELALGTTEYHVEHLTNEGLLATRTAGKFKAFFVASDIDRRDTEVLTWLRQSVCRSILATLLREPHLSQSELAARLQLAKSTLAFHLRRLTAASIVLERRMGRSKRYEIAEPDRVAALLGRHGASCEARTARRSTGNGG